jgi:hypothetical protein
VNQQLDPNPVPGLGRRWYVVDRTGRAVSIGYRRREHAQAELDAITATLRQELQRLGRSQRRITTQMAGFSVGAVRAPNRAWQTALPTQVLGEPEPRGTDGRR